MTLETKDRNAGRRYAIFLSYRHSDNKEQGRQWATWLHQVLEGYEIPADLVGSTNNKGVAIPASLYPVFRDEEELPADADLTRNIRQALENSDLLVVLCSPRAVESRFVAEEIRYFKEIGKADRILALMIDGEPNALDDAGKLKLGIAPEDECLPEPLRYGVEGSDGKIDWSQRTEPIAADTRPEGRPAQGWTTGAAYREALQKSGEQEEEIARKVREYEERLELAKLKIVAGALGVPLGILTERDKAMQLRKARQRAQTMRRWLAAVGLLAVLALAGGIYAWLQRREAIRQQHEVTLAFSKADASAALNRIDNNQGQEAVAYLCRALRSNPENHDAAGLLFSVLTTRSWIVARERFQPEREDVVALEANGQRALTRHGTMLRLWDIEAHRVIRELPDPESSSLTPPVFTPDGQSLILAVLDSLQKVDLATGVASSLGKTGSTHAVDLFSRAFPFSRDGKQIALETKGEIQSWNLADNQPLGDAVKAPANPYDGMPAAVSGDGSHLLLSASGGKMTLWDNSGRLVLGNFETHRTANNPLRVWDAASGEPGPAELPYRSTWLKFAAFSHDGRSILAATTDEIPNIHNTLRIWDAASGEPRKNPILHDGDIRAAEWSADDRFVLTASRNVLRVWDAGTGQLVAAPLYANDDFITAWFSPDGTRIIAPVLERTGVDFSAEPGLRLTTLNPNGPAQESFYSVKTVLTWDAALADPAVVTLPQPSWALDARFSPNGRWVVTVSGKAAQVWDASTRQLRSTVQMDDVPVCIVFSPDSERLLLVSNSRTAQVWNLASGEAVSSPIRDEAELAYASEHNRRSVSSIGFAGPAHPSRRVIGAFSPDGKSIALVSGFGARIWDAATSRPISGPLRHVDYVTSVAFSPDGRRLLTSSLDGYAQQWDVATGKAFGKPIHANSQIQMATFSRNGSYVATASGDQIIQTWDALTGKPMSPPIRQEKAVEWVQFSPDSKCVAAFSGETARVWNAVTGEAISAPITHTAPVTSICFSPDGNFVLTGSEDRTARIWNAATGLPVSVRLTHEGAVNAASFSADGRFVITASEKGPVKIWPVYSSTPPAWTLDFAELIAGCRLDSTGNPSYSPGKTMDWARQQASQEPNKSDRFVVWVRQILKLDH